MSGNLWFLLIPGAALFIAFVVLMCWAEPPGGTGPR